MRRHFLFVCAFALLSAPCITAQQPLLPDQFRSWHKKSCIDKPMHPVYGEEAGERAVLSCQFTAEDKSVSIWAGKYRDPSSAYEVYTGNLRSGMMPANLGQVSAFDKDGVVILIGSIVFSSTANISREDLKGLVQEVEATSGKAPLPPIPTYLPMRGRALGTERYALGPVAFHLAIEGLGRAEFAALSDAIGFNSGAEAMLARYQTSKENAVLLLIDYPTPQLAEQHLHHLEQRLPANAKQAGMAIERKGSLLSVVLAPSSPAYAEALRNAVNYGTQVTWNEASQTLTDPPWTSVMAKLFVGTGIFMLMAVVLGIAFGGVRVVTKIFFPGKVFDRPERMEILQLGLSGKRIDPRDFY